MLSQCCEMRLPASSCSVCLHGKTRVPLDDGSSWNLTFENPPPPPPNICRENSSFIETWQKLADTVHEDICTLTGLISPWILRRMRNVSDKNCRENQIQSVHKRMVRFQKLIRNLFLTLPATTYTVSSDNCPPNFSCATSSSLLMLTAGPRG